LVKFYRTEKATELLEKLIHDEDRDVREQAEESLKFLRESDSNSLLVNSTPSLKVSTSYNPHISLAGIPPALAAGWKVIEGLAAVGGTIGLAEFFAGKLSGDSNYIDIVQPKEDLDRSIIQVGDLLRIPIKVNWHKGTSIWDSIWDPPAAIGNEDEIRKKIVEILNRKWYGSHEIWLIKGSKYAAYVKYLAKLEVYINDKKVVERYAYADNGFVMRAQFLPVIAVTEAQKELKVRIEAEFLKKVVTLNVIDVETFSVGHRRHRKFFKKIKECKWEEKYKWITPERTRIHIVEVENPFKITDARIEPDTIYHDVETKLKHVIELDRERKEVPAVPEGFGLDSPDKFFYYVAIYRPCPPQHCGAVTATTEVYEFPEELGSLRIQYLIKREAKDDVVVEKPFNSMALSGPPCGKWTSQVEAWAGSGQKHMWEIAIPQELGGGSVSVPWITKLKPGKKDYQGVCILKEHPAEPPTKPEDLEEYNKKLREYHKKLEEFEEFAKYVDRRTAEIEKELETASEARARELEAEAARLDSELEKKSKELHHLRKELEEMKKRVEEPSEVEIKELKTFVEKEYNPAIEKGEVPDWIKNLIEKKFIIIIKMLDGSTLILKVVSDESGKIIEIKEISEEEIAEFNPNAEVHTDEPTVRSIMESDKPEYAFKNALEQGKIIIKGRDMGSQIKYRAATFFGRIIAKFIPSPYDVKQGEEKIIEFKGMKVKLWRSVAGYRMIKGIDEERWSDEIAGWAPSPHREPIPWKTYLVMDENGVVKGYTTHGIQKLLAVNPEGLSPDAGIIAGWKEEPLRELPPFR